MIRKIGLLLAVATAAVVGIGVAAPSAHAHGPVPIKFGDRNSNVQCVQSGLNIVIGAGLVVDGIFGNRTLEAVKIFQRKMRLDDDGIVGKYTGGWLIQMVNASGKAPGWRVSFGALKGLHCHMLGGTAFIGHY